MTKEGRIREDLLMKNGWRDSLLYSVLEQEWSSKDADKNKSEDNNSYMK
ncbi:hypothetical protein ACE4RR_12290 [Alteribacillus sp. HJP-4]